MKTQSESIQKAVNKPCEPKQASKYRTVWPKTLSRDRCRKRKWRNFDRAVWDPDGLRDGGPLRLWVNEKVHWIYRVKMKYYLSFNQNVRDEVTKMEAKDVRQPFALSLGAAVKEWNAVIVHHYPLSVEMFKSGGKSKSFVLHYYNFQSGAISIRPRREPPNHQKMAS